MDKEYFSIGDSFLITENFDGIKYNAYYKLSCVGDKEVNLISYETGVRYFYKSLVVNDIHKINKDLIYKHPDINNNTTIFSISKEELFCTLNIKYNKSSRNYEK